MAVSRAVTAEEKRELVYAYVALPYGKKAAFLREQAISDAQIRVWRAQVSAGTLELGLIPRGGLAVSMEESAALVRLVKEKQALQARLEAEQAEHERALAAKDAELAVQRRAVAALGKAIEILHPGGAGKSSSSPDGVDQRR